MDGDKLTASVPEAAKLLGISKAVAYRMAKDGSLPVIRCGVKLLRVPIAALQKKLQEAGQQHDSKK